MGMNFNSDGSALYGEERLEQVFSNYYLEMAYFVENCISMIKMYSKQVVVLAMFTNHVENVKMTHF